MIFSNNPEKLSLFGGGCNENDRILDLYGGLIGERSSAASVGAFCTDLLTPCTSVSSSGQVPSIWAVAACMFEFPVRIFPHTCKTQHVDLFHRHGYF